jgi:putative metallopeptidase DUF4344
MPRQAAGDRFWSYYSSSTGPIVTRLLETVIVPRSARAAVAALALLCAFVGWNVNVAPAGAEDKPKLHNENVGIQYLPPRSDKYHQIYERLKARQYLEELDTFLSPLNLSEGGLTLSLEEGDSACKSPNSYYDGRGTLHLCYSWFYALENEVAKEYPLPPGETFSLTSLGLIPGFTRAEVIVGASVQVTLHELGHAVFDVMNIPRFGREEDAADQFAGFFMVQFGPQVAMTTIKGTYNVWHHFNAAELKATNGTLQIGDEADAHSLSIQRSYNALCLAYGKDEATFKDLAESLLPRVRRERCKEEYVQAELAFKRTLLPKIDVGRMKQVQTMQIFRPEDFKF